jgi:hypothetical protein
VACAIAALSGRCDAIAVSSNPRYRTELLDEVTDELHDTFTARAEYLACRAG